MIRDQLILLTIGAFFPLISLISGALCYYAWIVNKRHSSAIYVPFVGPVLLSIWLVRAGKPLWLLPVPWALDLGTIAFLFVTPRLLNYWWKTSRFTLLTTLEGAQGYETATMSLHKNGVYLLRKYWYLKPGEFGLRSLCELGRFEVCGTVIRLHSDSGDRRTLRQVDGGSMIVDEDEPVTQGHSLQGWRFAKM